MINRMIGILILLIFRSLTAMSLDVPLMVYIRGAIQNYVDFFYNFRTDNRPHMKLAIHIIECTWQVIAKF